MTKEEVKREHRESEGDPHVKSKLRSLRAAMSRNQMLAAVGQADVVITNPTHVAVALHYDPSIGPPRVVARGADTAAARIRARAAEEGVPVIESPPLARSLYAACRTDEEIPAQMYQAVATVLAFVHRLAGRSGVGGPLSLHVPDTWTPPGLEPGSAPARIRPRRPGRPAGRARPRRSLTAGSPVPIHQGRTAPARTAAGPTEHGRRNLSMDT
jgi:flagellar biosynthetic protein FlhB